MRLRWRRRLPNCFFLSWINIPFWTLSALHNHREKGSPRPGPGQRRVYLRQVSPRRCSQLLGQLPPSGWSWHWGNSTGVRRAEEVCEGKDYPVVQRKARQGVSQQIPLHNWLAKAMLWLSCRWALRAPDTCQPKGLSRQRFIKTGNIFRI